MSIKKFKGSEIGLNDSKGNQLKEGDKITNGKVTFTIEYNPGFFAFMCYGLFKDRVKFLHELADVIEEKYWKI